MCSEIMVDSSLGVQPYKKYIHEWYSGFKKLVNNILESGKILYIIAISRKMPRFFSWMRKNEASYGVEGLGALLDKTEYTTEHAIPFIFNERQQSDCEVIIVDDSMVYGNTMRKVSDDVIAFTGGKLPYISVIVSGKEVNLNLIRNRGCHMPNITSNTEVSHWMDYVSRCNAASELPVDVEFPIVHLKNYSKEEYRKNFKSRFSEVNRYELNHHKTIESLNAILDTEIVELTAMDFAKLRCFFVEDEIRLVVISPLGVKQDSLNGDSPFTDERMSRIWAKITDTAIKKNTSRSANSLVVMLNYLHSLNTFRRNWDSILPPDWTDLSLEVSDLMLLVGKRLAECLVHDMAAYLIQEYRESYTVERTGLPSVYVPKELETPYKTQRYIIAAKERGGRNVNIVLSNLFNQSRYDKSILGQNVSLFHRMHSSFFESFDSLKELVHSVFDVENLNKEINKSVDSLIDAGKIIPKYIPVVNYQGELYWRRYFTSAHSSVEL